MLAQFGIELGIIYFIYQNSHFVLRQDQHVREIIIFKSWALTHGAALHPEHWKQFTELPAESNGGFVEEAQFEEHSIGFESIRHLQIR